MPSSTSSSNQRLPALRWRELLSGSIAMLVICVCLMEICLTLRGIHPSLLDSPRLWGKERRHADNLGQNALALIGSSRILLDVDVSTLHRETGREPIQLAIEGSSFLPVLASLANDRAFTGDVMVEADEQFLALPPQHDTAFEYAHEYDRRLDQPLIDYQTSEDYLDDLLRSRLRSYADGTRPLGALLKRVITSPNPIQYLWTLPDREVLADYRLAPMPYLYLFRSLRNLDGSQDLPSDMTYKQIGAKIEAGISAIQPVDNAHFLANLPLLEALVRSIQARGGQVFFVKFPESGFVEETDERRFPRPLFWDRLTNDTDAKTLDFEDVPALRGFITPDGSHLDYRQRASFTAALVNALNLRQKDHSTSH